MSTIRNRRANIYKRGNTYTVHLSWYVGRERGQLKRGGFPTKTTANNAVPAMWDEVEANGGRRPHEGTLTEWCALWLDGLAVVGRAPATIHSYRAKLDTYVLPKLGNEQLVDIDTVELDRLFAEMASSGGKHGKALSARTVRYTYTIVRKLLADAKRKGLIASNPATEATVPSARAARAPEAQVWTPEQLGTFLTEVRDDYYAPAWWVIAFTGLRRAEACGLRWRDVDLDSGMLTVAVTLNQTGAKVFESVPKSERSRRTIDIDAATVAALRSWRARQAELRLMIGAGWKESGRVFTLPDGADIRPDTLGQAFARLVAASKLPRITLHGLRHSHGTHLAAAGRNHREIADRLGHDDAGFTLRTYVHTLPGAQREGAEAVAALVRASGAR